MRRLLLTIEAAFDTRLFPHGAILAPALPFDALTPPYPTVVRLKRPDGAEIETGARVAQTHFNRPYSERTIANTWMLTVALTDITKAGIPNRLGDLGRTTKRGQPSGVSRLSGPAISLATRLTMPSG